MTVEIEDLDPGTYHVREVLQPGWIQSFDGSVEITVNADGSFDLEFPDGTPLDPTDSGPLGSAGPYNFGNYHTLGVRTPGFWTNQNWQQSAVRIAPVEHSHVRQRRAGQPDSSGARRIQQFRHGQRRVLRLG